MSCGRIEVSCWRRWLFVVCSAPDDRMLGPSAPQSAFYFVSILLNHNTIQYNTMRSQAPPKRSALRVSTLCFRAPTNGSDAELPRARSFAVTAASQSMAWPLPNPLLPAQELSSSSHTATLVHALLAFHAHILPPFTTTMTLTEMRTTVSCSRSSPATSP